MTRQNTYIAVLLLITGFAVRMYKITAPPTDYHPNRQYICANIARGIYRQNVPYEEDWRQEIALLNAGREMQLEPRIIESIAAGGYRILGGEFLWFPLVFSALLWTLTGVPIFMLGRRLTNFPAATLALALHLFIPFGILGSRAFQPDILTVALTFTALLLIYEYFELDSPCPWLLTASALVSFLAIFSKPVSIFFIVATFGCLTWHKYGLKKSLLSWQNWLFAAIAIAPAVTYYLIGIQNNPELSRQSNMSFVPGLILTARYWHGWLRMIGRTVGILPFFAALVATWTFPPGRKRLFAASLWIGYFAYGFAFTYHIHTHDYYSLFLIPITAITLSPGLIRLVAHAVNLKRQRPVSAVAVICILLVTGAVILLLVGLRIREQGLTRQNKAMIKNAGLVVGISEKAMRFAHPRGEALRYYPRMAAEIGEAVGNSKNTVFLTHDYGKSLCYHGFVAGRVWPERRAADGSAQERFNSEYVPAQPEFFIITAVGNFANEQQDLKEYLDANYTILKSDDKYAIYNLQTNRN